MEEVIENEYITLWYHKDAKIVHHRVHKSIPSDVFRAILDKGVEIIKEKKAKKWLSDDKNSIELKSEDLEWGSQDWFPRASSAGMKFWAIVMPDRVEGKKTMKVAIDDAGKRGLKIEIFDDFDEAFKWLKAK
jgi:hypothetical protein